MRIPTYLVRAPSGFFHFRFMVPKALREDLGLSVIKRSLHTRDCRTAQVRALFWAREYAQAFAQDWPDMTKTLEELWASATGSTRQDYEITPTAHGYKVKADGREDHEQALEALALLPKHSPASKSEVAPRSRVTVPAVKSPIMLSKAIDLWLQALAVGAPNQKTLGQKALSVRELLAFTGDKRVDKLSEQDFAGFVSFMRLHRVPVIAIPTANYRMMYVAQFMAWAMKLNHYPRVENPAKGHIPYSKSQKAERAETHGWQAFSSAQIASIFSPQNFSTIGRDHVRWCLVLAVYTGARVNELAQLTVDDFSEARGVKYFSIDTQEENQSVKSPHSRRTLPMHQDLVDMGLWERATRLREAGERQLFPRLKHGQNRFGGAVTTAASRYIKSLGIKARGKHRVGVHSFRNSLIQHLDDCNVDDLASRVYVGHTINRDSHEVHYKDEKKQKKKIDLMLCLPHLPAKAWGINVGDLKALLVAPGDPSQGQV